MYICVIAEIERVIGLTVSKCGSLKMRVTAALAGAAATLEARLCDQEKLP